LVFSVIWLTSSGNVNASFALLLPLKSWIGMPKNSVHIPSALF